MLRNYIKLGFVVAAVAVAGWNINQEKQDVELSDLALANVDALATRESTCVDCYNFKLVSYDSGCKICKSASNKSCNIHDQVPC